MKKLYIFFIIFIFFLLNSCEYFNELTYKDWLDKNHITLKNTNSTITFVGAGTYVCGSGSTLLYPPLPSGTQPGDLLLYFFTGSNQQEDEGDPPIGSWPVRGWLGGSNGITCYKFATSGDISGSISVPYCEGHTAEASAIILAFRGVSQTQPFGTIGTEIANEVNSQIIPSITTSYSQEYVVIYGFYAYWAGPWATWTGLPTGAINLLGTNLDISSVSDGFAFYGLPAAVPPNTTISGVTENIVATWILGGVTFTLIPGP